MSLRDILNKYNFKFKKKYGQNFISDPGILRKIVNTAEITKEDIVIEIGPGAGTLTKIIAEKAKKVIAIEIDKDLIPVLNEILSDQDNIKIIHGDALELDLDEIVREVTGTVRPYKIVANLPYYITTPLVMHFLESGFKIQRIVVMVQKEVAERLTAVPGTKDYGALTITVNLYTKPRLAFTVPKHIFIPRPEVDSAVVDLEVLKEPPYEIKDLNTLKRLVKAAFNQRRKTLANSLKALNIEKSLISQVLKECGIDPKRRGETLSLEEFVKLANYLS